jgi:aspartyl-tRNA(Asn)/glutamyl-tRNA(Gln) amidotransferase subunit A
MSELFDLTGSEALRFMRTRESSVRELVQVYLDRLARYDSSYHIYLDVFRDAALRRADELDRLPEDARRLLPLFGVPMAVKDNLTMAVGSTTAGSRILEGYRATYTATVVERLQQAGAVVLGKVNLDEFAMGSSTEHSAYGPTHNPWDRSRVPGGSSGGSAAAVAARMALAAVGSDTGGSIRQPAAYCGVVGLLPTYGRVSRYGLIAFASSLDQVGPLARTVDDVALVFSVIAGADPRDQTSLREEVPPLRQQDGVAGLRIGVLSEFPAGIEPVVQTAVERTAAALEHAGAHLVPVSLPDPERALSAYYIIAPAEASSNLSRYDGIRFGMRMPADGLYDLYDGTRASGFGDEVKRRIMLGTFALSAGYYDAYYGRATAVRREIAEAYATLFDQVDVILCPTSPDRPFRLGERLSDPWRMYLSDLFTVSVNLAGLPALSVPAGGEDGLPTAVQVIGPRLSEALLFRVGRTIESTVHPMPWPALEEGASA